MIFVMGTTGYTGRWVVAELLKRKQAVRCLMRETSNVEGFDDALISWVTGDLERVEEWADALAGVDAVMCVAHIQYAPFVIRACQQHGISRVVFFSSTWRFSNVKTPLVEAVIAGEQAVEQSGLDYTLLRPTMIYGPGADRNISRLRAFMKKSPIMPIFGSGAQWVQPVFVGDVAKAAVDALFCSQAIGQAMVLAGAEALTYNEMIDTLSQNLKRFVIKVHVPLSIGLGLAWVGNKLFSHFPIQEDQIRRMKEDRAFENDEAKALLGFDPVDFKAGLEASTQLDGVPKL